MGIVRALQSANLAVRRSAAAFSNPIEYAASIRRSTDLLNDTTGADIAPSLSPATQQRLNRIKAADARLSERGVPVLREGGTNEPGRIDTPVKNPIQLAEELKARRADVTIGFFKDGVFSELTKADIRAVNDVAKQWNQLVAYHALHEGDQRLRVSPALTAAVALPAAGAALGWFAADKGEK